MGMSDQYDDGRYDSGYIEMPGGWCIPKSQAPEPFTFPRIQRGGIKYPARSYGKRTPKDQRVRSTKETHMPEPRMTKAQLEHELRINTELQSTLRQRRVDLQKKLKQAIPAEPHPFTMFTINLKFKMHGKSYQYLVLRSGDKYFTTGTKDGQQMFESWSALCDWLEGPDVYSHTDLEILSSAGRVVSFDSGRIEDLPMQQPPF